MIARNPSCSNIISVCNELEQALFSLPCLDERALETRLKIEEAIEVAYEIAYTRKTDCRILPFPAPTRQPGQSLVSGSAGKDPSPSSGVRTS